MTARTGDWQKALAVLQPLKAQIDAALAAGDVDAAVNLAFAGAAEAASLASEEAGVPGGSRVHSVYVELTPQGLDVYDDGTLRENGTYVNLTYQCEDIAPAEAELLADNWNDATLGSANWAVDSPLRGMA